MKHIAIATIAVLATAFSSTAQDKSLYVSEASLVIGSYQPARSDHSAESMAGAANAFLQTLDEAQKNKALHAIDSPERRMWTNLPVRPDDGGLRLGDCNEAQVKAVCNLLAAVLSEQGYKKMTDIMLADDQLLRGGRARPGFGTEEFAVVIFGTPAADKPWGLQLDGHHVGANVACHGDKVTLSPSFIGTQPSEFKIAEKGFAPMAGETAEAYQLLGSLSDELKKKAVVAGTRGGLQAGPGNDGKKLAAEGVSCASLDEAQKKTLLKLIGQWVNQLPPAQAAKRMKQLEEELDKTHFSWSGPTAAKSDISYRITGPSLIIEYACQSLGGAPLNHLHSVYRDPTNEYGGQLDKKEK